MLPSILIISGWSHVIYGSRQSSAMDNWLGIVEHIRVEQVFCASYPVTQKQAEAPLLMIYLFLAAARLPYYMQLPTCCVSCRTQSQVRTGQNLMPVTNLNTLR